MIRFEKDGDLWIATLDRQEKANSVTREMLTELADIATASSEAKVFVLTGAGKVFSAGADLDEMQTGLANDPVWERLSGALVNSPALTICALNGTLAGGSFGMVLACDLRVAAPQSKFFYPVMRLGFMPQPSDPPRLARIAGPSTAKKILMAGQKLDAEEALRCGLVDALSDDPLETARSWAEAALGAEAEHIAGIKALI